jgi:ribokinase
VAYAPRLPAPGETIKGSSFEQNFGGKGANQAVQCARLGLHVAMCGMVGSDSYGKQYEEALMQEQVDTRHLLRPMDSSLTLSTGIAAINVASIDGKNHITIIPGANSMYTPAHVDQLSEIIRSCQVMICQNELNIETTKRALEIASKHDIISILNPAPVDEQSLPQLKSIIGLCDIVCPNEVELSLLTGLPTSTDDQVKIAAEILISCGCRSVVVTLGDRGAYVLCKDHAGEFFVAEKVSVVDTVGAGDSFIGTLASNIARGSPLKTAVSRALHCASKSVTRKGAQKSYTRLAELGDDYRPPLRPSTRVNLAKDQLFSNI